MEAINILPNLKKSDETMGMNVKLWIKDCYKAMNDDFNSPILIAELFKLVKFINQIKDGSAFVSSDDLNLINLHLKVFVFDILGLKNDTLSDTKFEGKLKETVQLLIAMRNEARENKDFKLSDKIRDRLLNIGIQLKDGKQGTTFTIENK